MPKIIIDTTVIDFPQSGTDANWAPAVVEFAEAVEASLAKIGTAYDKAPRIELLPETSNGSTITLKDSYFPKEFVRSFIFNYSVYRRSDNSLVIPLDNSMTVVEQGTFTAIYDDKLAQWLWEQNFVGSTQNSGVGYNLFEMDNSADSVKLTLTAITGTYDETNSKISWSAKALLVQE